MVGVNLCCDVIAGERATPLGDGVQRCCRLVAFVDRRGGVVPVVVGLEATHSHRSHAEEGETHGLGDGGI